MLRRNEKKFLFDKLCMITFQPKTVLFRYSESLRGFKGVGTRSPSPLLDPINREYAHREVIRAHKKFGPKWTNWFKTVNENSKKWYAQDMNSRVTLNHRTVAVSHISALLSFCGMLFLPKFVLKFQKAELPAEGWSSKNFDGNFFTSPFSF